MKPLRSRPERQSEELRRQADEMQRKAAEEAALRESRLGCPAELASLLAERENHANR